MKKKTNSKAAAVIVAVMVIVSAAIIYFGWNSAVRGIRSGNNASVSLPMITTKLTQPGNGEEVNLQTLFTVIVPSANRGDVPNAVLEEALAEIMLELDSERLLDGDRVSYINENATALLNERLAEQEITTRVVVTDISSDEKAPLSEPPPGNTEVMDGLFQNID